MNLISMSLSGAFIIITVVVIRALFINRLPKKTFLALWSVALLRLLIPFSLPFRFSFYTLARQTPAATVLPEGTATLILPAARGTQLTPLASPLGMTQASSPTVSPWLIIWLVGMALCALYFCLSYVLCKREFRASLPVFDPYVNGWLALHPLKRGISVRKSSRISAPLTYGIFHPVILLPKNTAWADHAQVNYVLCHEYTHIRRLDALTKLLLTAAVCVHWFNPLVWVMFVLSNRDLELSCDEQVVRMTGEGQKSAYAMALIQLEERKSLLQPLCNHFSKNAIEERITAIMKSKRPSALAFLAALVLVICVATAFATSAGVPSTAGLIPGNQFTQAEYDQLNALRFEGYQEMKISAFQEKVWRLLDEDIQLSALLERMGQDESFQNLRYTDPTADFLMNTLEPLTAERYQERSFPGYSQNQYAAIEYSISCSLYEPEKVTVGQYTKGIHGIREGLSAFLASQDKSSLAEQADMETRINDECRRLEIEYSVDGLQYWVEFVYRTDLPGAETLENVQNALAPYLPFGLTWDQDKLTLSFNGKEARGIVDPKTGSWTTMHAGNNFSEGAVELIAVYENGALSGLREATDEEQAEWTALREKQTANGEPQQTDHSQKPIELEEGRTPGTQEDYQAYLSLMTPGYQDLSVAEFNERLLAFSNEQPQDRLDNVSQDIAWNDIQADLTDAQYAFMTQTVQFSNIENVEVIRAHWASRPVYDPSLSDHASKELSEMGRAAWASLYYQFSYSILDKTRLTVGERDDRVAGFLQDVHDFWDGTGMESLLQMDSAQIASRLNEFASQHSNELLTISLIPGQLSFEKQDERYGD